MTIAGYVIHELLYTGKHLAIYRAIEEKKATSRILKVLDKKNARSASTVIELKQEYQFLCQVESEFVIKVVDWVEDNEYAVIIMEDINGHSLKKEIEEAPFSVASFFPVAVSIAHGLADIHAQNIIHRDINPFNILLDSSYRRIKIIDFNIATRFDIKVSYPGNPEELQGTIPYISPEQTGRMNRRVDQRTDFYSLGATFYEMLSGQVPFSHLNPIEIVYDHLARDPEPLHLLTPNVPSALSRLILKLLAKNPEERYQSASGIKHDLEMLKNTAPINFKLGKKDFSGKLQIPEKLYGRKNEIQLLLNAYRGVSRGENVIIMVTGYSGAGKTALVNEIHKPITRDRGFFISGKFDQLQRTIPFSAFSSAFTQFCRLLLNERKEVLESWKTRILNAVEKSGKLLTDIIPLLESVIGPQPEVPEVGGMEARKRFNYIFHRFIQAVSSEDHPLVLFIDDLQWADLASLNLLHSLIESGQIPYFLFIGSYRDNETFSTHPLMTTIQEIRDQGIVVHTIPIKNLSWENVHEWLNDTLKTGCDSISDALYQLTHLVYQKTQGNAFFTIQFLENLCKENLLRFDFKQSRWTWDISEIEKQNITDNVVDLLIRKIRNLPQDVQDILKRSACIGNRFGLGTLSIIAKREWDENEKNLEIAISQQLLYPIGYNEYKFSHDRVHQAVYSLIPEEDLKKLHLEIGRQLLNEFHLEYHETDSPQIEQIPFDIVNHLNIGLDLVETESEKLELSRLNLEAGRQARRSGAYKLASDYIRNARQLLPPQSWKNYYDLTLSVFDEEVQASYLVGNYEEMETWVEMILNSTHSFSDTASAYEHRLRGLVAQNQPLQAVETLLSILKTLGVDIPSKPGKWQTAWMLRKTLALLKRRGIESITQLPIMCDPRKQLIIKLLYMGTTALVWAGQDVFPYILGTAIGFILKDGLTPESVYFLSAYAPKLVLIGDIPGAYRLGEVIMELLENRIHNEAIKSISVTVLSLFVLGSKQHFKKVSNLMLDNYHQTMNLGNFDLASHLLVNYLMFLGNTDTELPILLEKAGNVLDTLSHLKHTIFSPMLSFETVYYANMLGKNPEPAILNLDLDTILKNFQKDQKKVFICHANIRKLILAFLFEDFDSLLQYLRGIEEAWSQITSQLTFMRSAIGFYVPLAYLQLYTRTTDTKNKKQFLQKAKKSIETMREWAEFGPDNYLHKYFLMQAEFFRVTGNPQEAAEFYDKAIFKAYENEYINEYALANELAARFYLNANHYKFAALYFIEARNAYRKWGAAAKVKQLDEKYPKYMNMVFHGSVSHPTKTPGFSTETIGEFLDVKSLIKASQTLAGEIQLKGLLEKMIRILIENAGAQKCVLIQNLGKRLYIQAEGNKEEVTGVLQAVPVEESDRVPLSVIYYVANSMQCLVSDFISKDPDYFTDIYILANQSKSVVCFPVLSKGELIALIYLENNLVEGAFSPARLEVLNMLSSQIAISVENTQLYETLEEKVRQRTVALEKANMELEMNHQALAESHKKINDSINYASRIQDAVLPSRETLDKLLPGHFIIYKPCSVVSGDFYWVKQVNNMVIVAASDCTGHGVPGALVSMLGMAFLNEIVPQLALQSKLCAANILDELRKKVKIAIKQRGEIMEQKEGMDIALCIIDLANNKLQYAGAHNPIYIVNEKRLTEIKADKMPIGISRRELPFKNHEISFKSGSMVYLFSDGYADQNSEKSGDKFTRKKFKHLLVEISGESMSVQKELLEKRFDEWKGNAPLRDDILVFGIRL